MKKFLLIAFGALLAPAAFAQLHFNPASVSGDGPASEFDLFIHNRFVNNSTDTVFIWKRVSNNLSSASWQAAVCDNEICHAATVDSNEFVVPAGDSIEFSVHFYPGNTGGQGQVDLVVYAKGNETNTASSTYNMTAWGLGVFNPADNNPALKVYPNPAQDMLYIRNGKNMQPVEIFTQTGQLVKTAYLNASGAADVNDLPEGVYFIRMSDKGTVSSTLFVKSPGLK